PEESSTLRIIPNVADIESESIYFTVIKPTTPTKKKGEKAKSTDLIICEQCGAILSSDYAFCNKCGNKLFPKDFKIKTTTLSSKIKGVRTKTKEKKFSIGDEIIYLKDSKEYVKFCGITSTQRTQLFSSNNRYSYLLELTNNLDFIATDILGGELDKMLLISKNDEEEKCQFYEKDGIIYLVYGVFPDKKGKWILEQMAKYYYDIIRTKDVNNLNKLEAHEITTKFSGFLKFILKEYMALQEVFTDHDIPYLEDWIRIDYLGLSSMSIGVISLLLDEEGHLYVDIPGEFDTLAEEIEMKESSLTARVEAIAANTLGNTGAYPRWIAVKVGFQQYRFLTFKKYENDYFLSLISEGNLGKIEQVEKELEPLLYHLIDKPFYGNFKPFNQIKSILKKKLIQLNIAI
ncbi:MAG: hypothetical protein ACFE85_11625, partial [Candidatus Hodarchaeota archaeon]